MRSAICTKIGRFSSIKCSITPPLIWLATHATNHSVKNGRCQEVFPPFDWDTWSRFRQDENVLDFREARKTVQEYSRYRPLGKNEQHHLFDVFKLTILFDCIWRFHRGAGHDFYEKRK